MIDEILASVDAGLAREPLARPFVVGIAGGVGVGKTTLAVELAGRLVAAGRSATVLATDNFLFPNRELERRGLLTRKGFPESYDVARLRAAVETLRSGCAVQVPVYDHQTYDVLPDLRALSPTDVLLLEGVNVLQPAVADLVDLAMYIDVDEDHAHAWFLSRFDDLCRRGDGFYAAFASMSEERRREVAESAWFAINLVNLREHIAPTMAGAHVVVTKDRDHTLLRVVHAAAPRSLDRGADGAATS